MYFFKQFFLSVFVIGGWYWRFVPIVVLAPAMYYPRLREAYVFLPDISNWVFYLFATVLATVMLSLRLTSLELLRVQISSVDYAKSPNGMRVRLLVKNVSVKDINGVVVRLEYVENSLGGKSADGEFPLVLLSQQELLSRRATDRKSENGTINRHPFTLRGHDEKYFDLVEIDNANNRLVVNHELGEFPMNREYLKFHVKAIGGGMPCKATIKLKLDGTSIQCSLKSGGGGKNIEEYPFKNQIISNVK